MDTARGRSIRGFARRSVGAISQAILLSAILFGSALAAETEYPGGAPAIPPGQEDLIAAMLGQGAALPDGCKFAAGTAAYNTITAKYSCPAGETEFVLVHPSQSGDEVTLTESFAIAQRAGAPSPKLADALTTLVRSREADFEWLWPAKDEVVDSEEDTGEDSL